MQRSIDSITDFKSGQVLYIDYQGVRLYAEVIQTISDRKQCWVRPIALVKPAPCSSSTPQRDAISSHWASSYAEMEAVNLYDLRQGADLVCPQSLFQIALDTEVVPIIAELNRLKPQQDVAGLGENSSAHELLREFISQIWQTNPKLFNPNPNPKLFN